MCVPTPETWIGEVEIMTLPRPIEFISLLSLNVEETSRDAMDVECENVMLFNLELDEEEDMADISDPCCCCCES